MADYDLTRKKVEEQARESLDKKISTHNTVYDTATQKVKENYGYAIDEAEKDYEDDYRENAVQKKVNEFYIKEEMANMGLSDSGLSRSQITANQLSYSNRKNEIDRQRQSMVDGLTREMTSKVAELENERILGEQDIRDTHEKQIDDTAKSIHSSELEAETAAEKAKYDYLTSLAKTESDERIAKYKADKSEGDTKKLYTYSGKKVLDDIGNEINVYTDSSGKQYEAKVGINPYTGADNNKVYAAEKKAGIKFSSNGYQPLGLVSEGGTFNALKIGDITVKYNKYGKEQTIWVAPNKKYFYWNGVTNSYEEVPAEFVEQIKQKYT